MQLLFTTSRVGLYSLSHRLASASLTRVRSNEDEKPNEPLVTYDSQRASGGDLLSAEATLRVRHNPLRSAGDSVPASRIARARSSPIRWPQRLQIPGIQTVNRGG